jgi:hypothetical protein
MNPMYTDLTEPDISKIQKPSVIQTHILKPKLTGIKTALWMSFLMIGGILLAVAYLYYSVQYEGLQRRSLERSQMALNQRTSSLESVMDEYKQQIRALNQKMSTTVDQEIRGEIERRRIEIVNLQKKLRILEERNAAIDQQARVIQEQPAAIIPSDFGKKEKPKREVKPEAKKEAAPIIQEVKAPAPSPTAAPSGPVDLAKNSRILTINRKFQFVVINLGAENGVSEGKQFIVLHEGQETGLIQVEKLYDSFSAATILEESPNAPIEVGDHVRSAS